MLLRRRAVRSSRLSNRTCPDRGCRIPAMVLSSVVLPGAVGADDGHDLPGRHVQRDALQHPQLAVPGLKVQ